MKARPLCTTLILAASIVTGHAQTGVFTRSYDIARTGANTHETR